MSDATAATALLDDLPALHFWDGRPQVGGLDKRLGMCLVDGVMSIADPAILETGAGASTLLFLTLTPSALTSIAPDDQLRQRMIHEAASRSISTTPLRFIVERSEIALPSLALAGESVDVGFIDGNHGWPAVFVDFCYINMMLRQGGLLFVDDLQLHSVAQLFLLLRQQEQFELERFEGKMAMFRKVSDDRFLPDWRREPFVANNSLMRL
jgi:hypothetical protein